MSSVSPSAADLVDLSAQLERDRSLSWQELQRRDFAIGAGCDAEAPRDRLHYWLRQLRVQRGAPPGGRAPSEVGLIVLASLLSFLFGFFTMAGFLFVHPQLVVNVLWFFAVFVLLQLLLCLLSLWLLLASLAGAPPRSHGLSPARWLLARTPAGRGLVASFGQLAQRLLLRVGQAMGVAFVCGCLLAFVVVLAFNDVSFVWSSTFRFSAESLQRAAELVATPWSGWLPSATVDAAMVEASRYRPTVTALNPAQLGARHGWWPFLLVSMLCYALLPRLLLSWLAGRLYRRSLDAAFAGHPGVDLVLQRMSQPGLHTQHEAPAGSGDQRPVAAITEGAVVVSWSDAIAADDLASHPELRGLEDDGLVPAGLSLEQDRAALARAEDPAVTLVLLVVKAWEPPLSELSDFVVELAARAACVVFLRPLPGQDIPAERLEDWKRFSSALPAAVQVKALGPQAAGVAS
jgi:hypothetical protein